MTFTEPLTWTCRVCGKERPDAEIAVLSRVAYLRGETVATYPFQHNTRYCRDNEACRAGAESAPGLAILRFLSSAVIEAFPDRRAQIDLVRMVPEHLHEGIAMYLTAGRRQGDFLTAVFEGDLVAAVLHADGINAPRLAEIVRFMIWHCPAASYGTPGRVRRWIEWRRPDRAEG